MTHHLFAHVAGQVYVWLLVISACAVGGAPLSRWATRRLLGRIAKPARPAVHRVPTWGRCTPAALRKHPQLARLDKRLDRIARRHPKHTAERSNR